MIYHLQMWYVQTQLALHLFSFYNRSHWRMPTNELITYRKHITVIYYLKLSFFHRDVIGWKNYCQHIHLSPSGTYKPSSPNQSEPKFQWQRISLKLRWTQTLKLFLKFLYTSGVVITEINCVLPFKINTKYQVCYKNWNYSHVL